MEEYILALREYEQRHQEYLSVKIVLDSFGSGHVEDTVGNVLFLFCSDIDLLKQLKEQV